MTVMKIAVAWWSYDFYFVVSGSCYRLEQWQMPGHSSGDSSHRCLHGDATELPNTGTLYALRASQI